MGKPDMPGFSPEQADSLSAFCAKGAKEIVREVPDFAVEAVLERLLSRTTVDMQAVFGFHSLALHTGKDGPSAKDPASFYVPLGPKDIECVQAAEGLDRNPVLRGESMAPFETTHVTSIAYSDALIAYLHERLWKRGTSFVNTLFVLIDKDGFKKGRKMLRNLLKLPDGHHEETAINLIWALSRSDGTHEEDDLNALRSVLSFPFVERLKEKFADDFPRAIDFCLKRLVRDEKLQRKMLVMLQGLRLLPQTYLAEAMTRQGYRTFLQMEDMTQHDLWARIKKDKEQDALTILHAKPVSAEEIQEDIRAVRRFIQTGIDNTAPENERQLQRLRRNQEFIERRNSKVLSIYNGDAIAPGILSEQDQKIWDKAASFLKKNEPEKRRLLTEKIGCAAYRQELKKLGSASQWVSVTAKEKEIIHKIFTEVMLYGYEHESHGHETYKQQGHRVGTPSYAVNKRKFNCFTGPWLIASLLMESGIHYSQLYYCSVNSASNANAEQASNHAALLIKYSDASIGITDYGFHTSNQQLPLTVFSHASQRAELVAMMNQAFKSAQQGEKIVCTPVHLQIPNTIADLLKVPRDMHILPLDQGLTSMSLLNTGITFEREGKKEEAKTAYEMGLVSNPSSPDLLCRLAILLIQEKDFARAGLLLRVALDEYKDHLLSIYYSGMLAWHQGNVAEAYTYFKAVADDPRAIWGDDIIKENAIKYYRQLAADPRQDAEIRFGAFNVFDA